MHRPTHANSVRPGISGLCLSSLCVLLLGCGAGLPANGPTAGPQLRGTGHGGQQPVSGAATPIVVPSVGVRNHTVGMRP